MVLALFVMVGALAWTPQSKEFVVGALSLEPAAVRAGEVWRLITYAFLTGDPLDLFFKLLIFYFIGAPLEAAWGTRRFLTLLGVSIIGGGLTGALLNVPLAGGWAPSMTLMLIHGFLFPESIIYIFFVLPVRIKTFALVMSGLFLAGCIVMGVTGLALFAGLFCGVLYYVLTTRSLPWVRRRRRVVSEAAANPLQFAKEVSNARLMEHAQRIVRKRDAHQPISAEDRKLIDQLAERADPGHVLCSRYSFSPRNNFCPACAAFGRCLRRVVEEDAPTLYEHEEKKST